jgi:hypothetical protein
MEQNPNTSLFSLNLDAQNSYTLRSAASWSKVLGVVGLILGFLFVILGIVVQQAVSRYNGYSSYRSGGLSSSAIGNAGMAVYMVLGLIMIVTSVFALNAGNKINQALKTNDQMALNSGFAGVRNYFAFWAVIIILILLLVLISLLTAIGQ